MNVPVIERSPGTWERMLKTKPRWNYPPIKKVRKITLRPPHIKDQSSPRRAERSTQKSFLIFQLLLNNLVQMTRYREKTTLLPLFSDLRISTNPPILAPAPTLRNQYPPMHHNFLLIRDIRSTLPNLHYPGKPPTALTSHRPAHHQRL